MCAAGYLLNSVTADAGPGSVKVFGRTLSSAEDHRNGAKADGTRVFSVGTTMTTLESGLDLRMALPRVGRC
jgi:hypothetical protein